MDKNIVPKNLHKGSFAKAFLNVFSSLSLVKQHRLYAYFIIPFFLNIVILSSIFYFSFHTLKPLINNQITGAGFIFDTLRFIIAPLLLVLLLIITVLIYSIIGGIITAPFNDFLSQKIETTVFGEKFDEKLSLKSSIENIVRVTANLIKLLLLMIVVYLLIFLLNLIPVLGSILSTFLGFLTTAFFFGFQFYDFPLERRKYTFGGKLKFAFRFAPQVVGVGVGFFLLSMIPVINFLGLNMATIAATIMFNNYIKPVMAQNEP